MFEKLDKLTSRAGKLKVLVVSYSIYNKLKQQAFITEGADLHYYNGTPIIPSDQIEEDEVYLLERPEPFEVPFEPILSDYMPKVLIFKGSVERFSDLPADAGWGEVYFVEENGQSYAMNDGWEELNSTVRLNKDGGINEY